MPSVLLFALLGLAYGFVLQRSGFCFARAAYELCLLGTREAVRGVLAGLLVGSVGFAVVTLARMRVGLPAETHLLLLPAGAGTLLGATLFGLGMSLAGMCGAGTLQRLGEGYVLAWITLAGMLLAAALNPLRDSPPWLPLGGQPYLWLGRLGGPVVGSFLTIAALALLWFLTARSASRIHDPVPPGSPLGKAAAWLGPPALGGILLGLLNTAQMAAAAPWTVHYPLALVPSVFSRAASAAASVSSSTSSSHRIFATASGWLMYASPDRRDCPSCAPNANS